MTRGPDCQILFLKVITGQNTLENIMEAIKGKKKAQIIDKMIYKTKYLSKGLEEFINQKSMA